MSGGLRCGACGELVGARVVTTWIGSPPPGWTPGDPVPHICDPAKVKARGMTPLEASVGIRGADLTREEMGALDRIERAIGAVIPKGCGLECAIITELRRARMVERFGTATPEGA